MHYFCISFTHKNTDISLREKLSLSVDDKQNEFLKILNSKDDIVESLVLSTCNRVELIAFVKKLSGIADYMVSTLSLLCGVDKELLMQKADIFEDSGAIHHLFAVASSLDSLVIGETQIAGQLKNAFNFSVKNNYCGVNLSRAIQYAFKCAAKIRNQTQISKNPISVASVAVAKAKELINLKQKEVIVIGAGEMGELACKHLIAAGARVIILNRDIKKAENLSKNLGVLTSFDSIEKLAKYINEYEVFFSATNANSAIITTSLIKEVNFKRYFFDIAVPRDIDLDSSEKIRVFAVDDLEEVVRKNLALRECEASVAYSIIGSMTNEFFKYLNDLALHPIIKELRLRAKECARIQLEIAIKKGYLRGSDKEEARKLIHQVFKAFLHNPTINLKKLQGKIKSDSIISAMRYIFNLNNQEENKVLIMENDDEI
ncbi:glutamyl-tRNA reductase [Campylobacter sp. LR264d]|uniref:glutamyl-tRNA reductase n=1 Tax=Campylobacter sp. LR264d TaxID=2593544 RepID=UPI0012392ECB|nr:glutamyl-tRNA reductase [Campylobacter sp. LR264d]KAA6229501.1 glutamyl-tRNA reductase [Campylobacter sp. LR264d]